MHQIHTLDPDMALEKGIDLLKNHGVFESSRSGEVLVMPSPVVTVWPPERSLASLYPLRDANPFFHLNEAIWMLKGDRDARKLDYFVSDFSKRFAESNGLLHGAYGHRWRNHFGFDQIEWIIEKLKIDSGTRQAVLQMWDSFPLGADDLTGNWKDRPCNTHIYFRINHGALDMTVCCRSNDMIWGAYGANIVHFGVLHEYITARLGCGLGTLYQFSNNFHAYTDVLGRLLLKKELSGTWDRPSPKTMPMFNNPDDIDKDLQNWDFSNTGVFSNNLFSFAIWGNFALQQSNSLNELDRCDWSIAMENWLERRRK